MTEEKTGCKKRRDRRYLRALLCALSVFCIVTAKPAPANAGFAVSGLCAVIPPNPFLSCEKIIEKIIGKEISDILTKPASLACGAAGSGPASKACDKITKNMSSYKPCTDCACQGEAEAVPGTKKFIHEQHLETRKHIEEEFDDMEEWLLSEVVPTGLDDIPGKGVFWEYIYEPLMRATHQLTTVAMHQMVMVGAFLDAKQQLEVQRMFQELAARAHKDYRPSMTMCMFGTNIRSLAGAERRVDITTAALGRWAQHRHLGTANASAAEGPGTDQRNRLAQFRERYCDVHDNNNGYMLLCGGASASSLTVNKDIDFARTTGMGSYTLTLNLDFTDGALTDDEQDVIALASNLYDHNVFFRIPETNFDQDINKQYFLDVRSIAAKRSVAEHSYFSVAGLKSLGQDTTEAAETPQYMRLLLEAIGTDPLDIPRILGGLGDGGTPNDNRPSYYAQMEILTKKIFQNPNFYADMYESPANTARRKVALQAISLMQDFDTLQSHLRTEVMLSVILEMELIKIQRSVQNRINGLISQGRARL